MSEEGGGTLAAGLLNSCLPYTCFACEVRSYAQRFTGLHPRLLSQNHHDRLQAIVPTLIRSNLEAQLSLFLMKRFGLLSCGSGWMYSAPAVCVVPPSTCGQNTRYRLLTGGLVEAPHYVPTRIRMHPTVLLSCC